MVVKSPHGSLLEEIRQTRPFRSLSQEAALGLFRTTGLVRRRHSSVVEAVGLTLQQYNVLRILRGAGAGGLATSSVVERMVEPMPSITRLIDRLEQRQLVARERSQQDRRQVFCSITETGLELLRELDPKIAEADDGSFPMLDDDELRSLIEMLDKVRRGYAEE